MKLLYDAAPNDKHFNPAEPLVEAKIVLCVKLCHVVMLVKPIL